MDIINELKTRDVLYLSPLEQQRLFSLYDWEDPKASAYITIQTNKKEPLALLVYASLDIDDDKPRKMHVSYYYYTPIRSEIGRVYTIWEPKLQATLVCVINVPYDILASPYVEPDEDKYVITHQMDTSLTIVEQTKLLVENGEPTLDALLYSIYCAWLQETNRCTHIPTIPDRNGTIVYNSSNTAIRRELKYGCSGGKVLGLLQPKDACNITVDFAVEYTLQYTFPIEVYIFGENVYRLHTGKTYTQHTLEGIVDSILTLCSSGYIACSSYRYTTPQELYDDKLNIAQSISVICSVREAKLFQDRAAYITTPSGWKEPVLDLCVEWKHCKNKLQLREYMQLFGIDNLYKDAYSVEQLIAILNKQYSIEYGTTKLFLQRPHDKVV